MRAFILSLALSFVVVLMVDTPGPATAQPSILPLAQSHSAVEEVYYYRRYRYGYRHHYRPYYGYGYRRHYYRPYYGYGYRRPYYGYGYRRHYYRRW
jgi:hypothetical protein